jgi:hypothetical protein
MTTATKTPRQESRWFMRLDPAVVDYRIDHAHGLVVESLSGDPHIDDDVAIGSHRVHSAPAFVRLRLAVRDLVRTDGVRLVDGERPRRSARGRDGQHLVRTALPGTRGGRDEVTGVCGGVEGHHRLVDLGAGLIVGE